MANLIETDEWSAGVYQIEQTDPVLGGAPNEASGAGLVNIPHLHLARRTRWLKSRVDALVAAVVQATTSVAGIVQLSTSVNSSSTTQAATPSAVKAANDNANARVPTTRTITAGGLATGGGDLTANRTITVPAANLSEAQAGVDNTKAMTPLRVAQAIGSMVGAASTTAAGIVRLTSSLGSTSETLAASALAVNRAAELALGRVPTARSVATSGLATGGGDLTADRTIAVPVASQAEAQAGVANNRAMTPLRVAQAIAALVPAASTAIAGIVRLSAATDSDSAATAATSSAVAAVNARVAARALASRTVTGAGLAAGGGDLTGDRVISVAAANLTDAEGGTDHSKAMTALRTAQAIERMTLGRGQTWSAPTRSLGTWYQNTTGRPIQIVIRSDKPHRIRLGTSTSSYVIAGTDNNDMTETDVGLIVPDGGFYMVESGQEFDQATWIELR